MNSAPRILIIALALTGWVVAEKPVKPPLTKYRPLWDNSPFTTKPVGPGVIEEENPLEDYALGGVSPIVGGYRVTLLNKKTPEERIIVNSDRPSGGYKILSVIRKSGDPLGTVVNMSIGSKTGTVSFDEKLLTLAPPPAPAKPQAAPGAPPQPGQPQQPQLQPGQTPPRQPRPRVVPPPTPTTPQAQPTQNTQRSDRPERRGGR